MKTLRTARLIIAAVSLAAAVGFLLSLPTPPDWIRPVFQLQLIPSMWGPMFSAALGTGVFWLAMTFLFGRVYCSTVCPVGTIVGLAGRFRRTPYRFRPKRQVRFSVLALYAATLILGQFAVAFVIEPWNIMRNITSLVNPASVGLSWTCFGVPVFVGMAAGAISLAGLLFWGVRQGREFCTSICPIGTALGLLHNQALFRIEIDPDLCDGCLKCEDVCQAGCINVAGRFVDNSRCVRCFECGAVCPHDAIRFQINRNRRMTPLLKKAKQT